MATPLLKLLSINSYSLGHGPSRLVPESAVGALGVAGCAAARRVLEPWPSRVSSRGADVNMDPSNNRPSERTAHPLRTACRTIAWGMLLGVFLLSRGASWTARAQVTGLVAAYGFEEGAGTLVADSSGNGNTGTNAGATWTTSGKYGGALVFNGTSAKVTIPDSASLDLTNAMTLEAWVYPTVAPAEWRAVIAKDVDSYYLMASSDNQNRPAAGAAFGGQNPERVRSGAPTRRIRGPTWRPPTIARRSGCTSMASKSPAARRPRPCRPRTRSCTIGADFYGEYFTGLIDEVRIYNRALTSGEIQTDSGTPLADGPRLVINQPAAGSTFSTTTISVAYSTTGDLTGVNHVHFRLDGNPEVMDLSFDGAYQFAGVPAGAHMLSGYLVHADHSAFPGSNTIVNFTTTVPDSVPPTVSIMSPGAGATVSGVITVSANAADAVGVAGVQLKLDGANLGTEDFTAPYSVQLNTATLANGSHTVQAVARDLGGNVTTSTAVSFTVSNGSPTGPSAIGQWSAPFSWPIVGLHAALLPTGKILVLGRSFRWGWSAALESGHRHVHVEAVHFVEPLLRGADLPRRREAAGQRRAYFKLLRNQDHGDIRSVVRELGPGLKHDLRPMVSDLHDAGGWPGPDVVWRD